MASPARRVGGVTEPAPALDIESFRKDRVAADAAAELRGMIYVLDLQERDPGVQRLRDWSLSVLVPQAGEVAVDVGCGTGTEVRRLAALVGPDGQAVGVEPHPGLREEAQRRAQGTTACFVDGDAVALPFDDASVDVIRCERVFQHLPDSDAAVREMARVLRPGGRVCVTDSDWGTAISAPDESRVAVRVAEYLRSRVPNPHAGRRLRAQMLSADLAVDPDIGSTAVIFPLEVLSQREPFKPVLAGAVAAGVLTAAEAEAHLEETVAAAERGEAFRAVTMFAVVGRRA